MADCRDGFRIRKLTLPGLEDATTAVPLVLQSDYKWNKDEGVVVKIGEETEGEGSSSDVSTDASVKLMLVDEALDLIKTVKKPVAVLAMCGPYRTGKSYFISRVVEQPGAFKLGHSMDVCTRGIWLSTTALECEEFVLLLLDTEGIGAVEGEGPESSTIKLLVTTVLLSSLLVYNSMEVPKHTDLLQMSSFAHLSSSINIGSKPKGTDATEFQKYFPQFMWLLRDVLNVLYDDKDDEMELIDYLNAEVLQPTGQKDCDNIIKAICTLFPQPLMCEWLPPPSDDEDALESIEKEENVDEYFVERSDEVISTIKASLRPKMGFDRVTKVTGSDLVELAKAYIGSINNKGSVPSLEQGWMAVIKLKLSEEANSLVTAYEKEMKAVLDGKLPMEVEVVESDANTETLMGLHISIVATKREALVEKIRQLLPKASPDEKSAEPAEKSEVGQAVIVKFERDIVVEENGKVTSGKLYVFVHDNSKASTKKCEEVWEKLHTKHDITNKYAKALNDCNAEICAEVCEHIQLLREDYKTEAVGPARDDVLNSKEESLEAKETVMKSIPGPPVNLTVVGKAKDAIKLQWDRPEINPDAAKKFIVQYRREKREWIEDAVTSEHWHIVRKLKSNTSYEFRVASWNDEGKRVRDKIEKMLKGLEGFKSGTRLGKLARAALSVLGFVTGTTAAPVLAPTAIPLLAHDAMSSGSKIAGATAMATAPLTVPLLATLGAPIVGGKVAYHVYRETGVWGELQECYVPQEKKPVEQGEDSSTTE